GSISTSSPFGVADDDEKYLFNSLMEEAIASSQLEGATTTREVAKKFLQTNRKPKDRSQRMILNNYLAIQEIRELKKEKLTPELLCHIQGIITKSTLSDESHEGRFRQPGDDKIVVEERMTGEVLHEPPDHFSVEWRVEEICDFANEKSKPFIHPVVKAIALHFAIGFVHPFIDGNGRTARAIFYWYMLKQGYWIFEFLPISRIFLDGPIKYARAYLYTETDDADLTYFCHYHMHVILRAITELHEYIAKQQEELKEAVDIVAGYSSELNHRQTDLIYDAIKHKGNVYTIAQHAGSHNVTKATARSDLFDLEAKGFLTKHKHSREWWFTPTEKLPS
ncbi:Fic family protein, partial [bacterium]|nr:Fic family protein [bacterium]